MHPQRIKISTIRPSERTEFDADLLKQLRIFERRENSSIRKNGDRPRFISPWPSFRSYVVFFCYRRTRDIYQGFKRSIHGLIGRKYFCQLGGKQHQIAAFLKGCVVFSPDTYTEVFATIFGAHFFSLLHIFSFRVSLPVALLLDEPSNDLDVETLRALEDALLEFAGCVAVIIHDRWFLDRIATHILACEGDSKWTFFDGNYQEYEADKRKRLGEEGAKPKRIRYKPISR